MQTSLVSNRPSGFVGPRQSKASALPVVSSAIVVTLTTALLFVLGPTAVAAGIVSYVVAAVGTSCCVAWDAVLQRKGMKNPNFTQNRSQAKILQVLALFGVGVALLHVIRISEAAAEFLSELWGLV